MEKTIKQFYEAPTTAIIKVKMHSVLLENSPSPVSASRSSYGTVNREDWD